MRRGATLLELLVALLLLELIGLGALMSLIAWALRAPKRST